MRLFKVINILIISIVMADYSDAYTTKLYKGEEKDKPEPSPSYKAVIQSDGTYMLYKHIGKNYFDRKFDTEGIPCSRSGVKSLLKDNRIMEGAYPLSV